MKKAIFGLITALFTLAVIAGVLFFSRDMLVALVEPKLLDYAMTRIPEDKLNKMYAEAVSDVGFYWDTAPDPNVARLAKRGATLISKKAEIKINNAGLRSTTHYITKPENVFRIVCLGDSFVFGEAGKEDDRFCNQIGDYYRDNAKTMDGKRIETYAIGLGSWTAVQEAAYLSSRISAYDPDIILMLTVANDITDMLGVTGGGVATSAFSPEHREWGSGVFSSSAGLLFGYRGYTMLRSDFSAEARERWEKAWLYIKRLVQLQESRDKKILLTVLDRNADYFIEVYKEYYASSGIKAPALVTNFYAGPETRLPHDGHPSRLGHQILAAHYINALDDLGWIPMDAEKLPAMDAALSLDYLQAGDRDTKLQLRKWEFKRLKSAIDFQKLSSEDHWGFLGGLFPEKRPTTQDAASVITWGTVRTGFVLLYPDDNVSHNLTLEIEVPAVTELYPFDLDIRVNNEILHRLHLETIEEAGRKKFEIPVAGPSELNPVLEILMETDSYFSGITDHRMKSYQLLNASLK